VSPAIPLQRLAPGPAAGYEQPFEMLEACHERVQRMLALLGRLRAHVAAHGADAQAREAARDVQRYFDVAAPQHHLDEERHVLPALRATGDPALAALAGRLAADHRRMEAGWAAARALLAGLQDGRLAAFDAAHEAVLQDFADLYAAHVAAEESVAFPAARARLEPPAVAAMAADMMARRGVR
jgi:hemerythrin-like domain-containing protein